MAAYAALVSLITTMDHIQKHSRLSISFDTNQMESIIEKVGLLLDFVENDTHGVISTQVEVLESQIASVAYAAEDLIESHVVGQIQAMKDAKRKFIKPLNSMRLLCCLKKGVTTESDLVDDQIHGGSISVVDLQTVIDDMDSVKKKVMAFKEESGSRDDMQPTYLMPTATTTASSSTTLITTDKNTMVGFDEQLTRLLDKLTGQRSNRQIIPIVGMGGIAKTTLAKNAYEHSLTVQHFDIRTWVTTSQKYNVIELLLQLLREKNIQKDEQLLGEKMYKRLWGRRISNVATHFDSSLFELSSLDEDQSWDLFCKKTFGEAECPVELEDIGNEIVKKCKGLPLAICVIGGLLGRSHMTQKCWKNISKDLISILNSREDENCSSILSLSYTYLPAHLKPCFLYMGIFPEDDEIRVSQLIKLWVAEGFIKSNESQSLEEIARGYLNDLIDRNLILKQLRSNGRIKFCRIHDLLRDLSLKCIRFRVVKLPSSINVLWNLQTIIIRNNKIKAPSEIWMMRQLRHVDIYELHLPDPPQSGDQQQHDFVMQNLQTLKNVVNFVWSEEACKRVVNVRKLQIEYDSRSESSNDYLLYNICHLHKLESLTCLPYTVHNVLQKLTFPSSLKKLYIVGSKVHWKDLTIIGSLPNLEVLNLDDVSAVEPVWNPVEGEFLRLKYLFIS
ncbi:hypothetical protein ABFS83_04G150900 [Erythranthe nasuta]